MAITTNNLTRSVLAIGQGLDNLDSPSSQLYSIGIRRAYDIRNEQQDYAQLLSNQNAQQLQAMQTAAANPEALEQIQSLSNQVGTQQARIAAGAGTQILDEYNKEEQKKKKGILQTALEIIDAPRNALANTFKYIKEGDVDGPIAGFFRGLTHEETYSGYDMAEDMGLDGVAKGVTGFVLEMVTDPLTYIPSTGVSKFIKGFFQGPTKNLMQGAASRVLKEGVQEIASQAVEEGAEKAGTALATTAASKVVSDTAKEGLEAAVQEATAQATKQNAKGFRRIINNFYDTVDTIGEKLGLQFGPAKVQAVADISIKEAHGITNMLGGASGSKLNLTDAVLDLASTGKYDDDVMKTSLQYRQLKKFMLENGKDAVYGTSDKVVSEILDETKDQLLQKLRPHKLDLRIDIFGKQNLDTNALRASTEALYNEGIERGFNSLKAKYGAETLDNLKDIMGAELGKEITEGQIMLEAANEAFTPEIMGQVYKSTKDILKNSISINAEGEAVKTFKNSMLNALLDDVAADQLTASNLLNISKKAVYGEGLSIGVPFTNIQKELVNGENMWAAGSKLRTLLKYETKTIDGVSKVVERGGLAGMANAILDRTSNIVESLVGRVPIIASNLIDTSGKPISERFKDIMKASPVDRAHAWAAKQIINNTRNATTLGATKTEHRIKEMFDVMKQAGFKDETEIEGAGNLMQQITESRLFKKGMTDDDVIKSILGYTEMDDTAIRQAAEELTKQARTEIENAADVSNIAFVTQSISEDGLTFSNKINEKAPEFREWYNNTLNGYISQLTNRSNIKAEFSKFSPEKQKAIMQVTRMMNEDITEIGTELAKYGMIPEDLLFSPEYWYMPHKLNMELLLDKGFDHNRRIIGKRTEAFNMVNASAFKRTYPMTATEVNKILEKKYGIPNMLETNMFYTYMMYAMEQSKIISEARESFDILNTFGTRVVDDAEANVLRGAGYDIIVRKHSVDGYMINDKSLQAMQELAKTQPEIVKQIRKLQQAQNNLEKVQANIRAKDMVQKSQEMTEAMQTLKTELKTAIKNNKEAVAETKQAIKASLKGTKISDDDLDMVMQMAQEDINNFWVKGKYYNATDSMGNLVAVPEMKSSAYYKGKDGPVLFIGNPNKLEDGYRIVPDVPSIVPEGSHVCYINAKKPYIRQVDNLQDEIENVKNLLNTGDLDAYTANGYDAIQLVDKTGASAVIPFDETQVFLQNPVANKQHSGATKFAASRVNTIDPKTGKLKYAGSWKKTYIKDDTIITVSSLTKSQRENLASSLRAKYNRSVNKMDKHSLDIKSAERQIASLTKDIDKADAATREAALRNDMPGFWERGAEADALRNARTAAEKERDRATKALNDSKNNDIYRFIEALRTGKDTDVAITRAGLYDLLGNEADTALRNMGYDSILISNLDEPAMYKPLADVSNLPTRDQLKNHYLAMQQRLKQNEALRLIYDIMSDNGIGTDPIVEALGRLNDKELNKLLRNSSKLLDRLQQLNLNAGQQLESAAQTATSPAVKRMATAETRLLGKISAADGPFYKLGAGDFANYQGLQRQLSFMVRDEGFDVYAVPSGIIDYFNKAITKEQNEGVSVVKSWLYKFNKIWKPSVTSWRPTFGYRNLASGYFNSWLYAHNNIFDPEITTAAFNMAAGKNMDKVVEIGSFKGTLQELKETMVRNGAINGFINTDVQSIQEMIARNVKGLTEQGLGTAKLAVHPLQSIQKFNSGVEDYNRALLYLACLKNGDTPAFAGEMVKKLQFDYQDLTEVEKSIKRWFPFYTWLRNNLPLQLEKFLDNPRLYNMLMRRVPEFTRESSGMSEEDYNNMPDWVKEAMPMTIGYDEKEGRYILFDTSLPYQDLSKLGGVKDLADEMVSMLHPLAKVPAEMYLNKNLYTGAALESYTGETAEKAIQGEANPVLNSLGRVAPGLLRSMPGVTEGANQLLNTFGLTRDTKYLNSTQGTTREGSTVYGSKDVAHTGIGLINLLENTMIDTNQLRYYSPDLGTKDALYQQQRDYGNLIQKLTDQGYAIPSSSELRKMGTMSTNRAASTLASSVSTKGVSMIQRALLDYPITTDVRENLKGAPTSTLDVIRKSLQAGGYAGITGTSGEATVDWAHLTAQAKKAYTRWSKMDEMTRPANWYTLLNGSEKLNASVYNKMVLYNFDSTRLEKWFNTGI